MSDPCAPCPPPAHRGLVRRWFGRRRHWRRAASHHAAAPSTCCPAPAKAGGIARALKAGAIGLGGAGAVGGAAAGAGAAGWTMGGGGAPTVGVFWSTPAWGGAPGGWEGGGGGDGWHSGQGWPQHGGGAPDCQPVPEPAAIAVFLTALLALAVIRWRRA